MPGSSWLLCNGWFSDQHVHRIIARSRLIAPRVRMTCRLLLRCVASHSVLPRERFSPLALFGPHEMSDLSPECAPKRTLARSLLATRAGCPQKRRFARFAVQLVDQTRKRVLARNIGTAGGNEQAMQRRDRVFAAPFVIVDERQDRVSQRIALLCRP